MKKGLLFCIVLLPFSLFAQTFDWWANNVHWDGVTKWSRYMLFFPGYQGPNSLPVPEIGNGSIDSVNSIGLAGDFYFSKGDKTQNLRLTANYCLVKKIISFDANWVPAEWYNMSHEIKTERHVFSAFYYNNFAQGDLLLNTNIQLLNKWRKHIHLALRIGYRFPISSGLGSARYTDSPGYYFDLSFAKPFSQSGHWKMNGMLGFYSWQTNQANFFQDDCFLFGAGLEYNNNNWKWQMNSCGYLGYQGKRDKPVVLRIGAEKKINRITALLHFQQGLHDFKYSSFETGARLSFGK